MTHYTKMRKNMVDGQLRPNDVNDSSLVDAFLDTPRELFVPRQLAHIAYMDASIPLENGRHMLSPLLHARLLGAAQIKPCAHVLYLAACTGYGPALLAHFSQSVVAVESSTDLATMAQKSIQDAHLKNVTVYNLPLEEGYKDAAPYDVIVIEGCVEEVPHDLFAQLKEGGVLVSVNKDNRCIRLEKQDGQIIETLKEDVKAPLLDQFRIPRSMEF